MKLTRRYFHARELNYGDVFALSGMDTDTVYMLVKHYDEINEHNGVLHAVNMSNGVVLHFAEDDLVVRFDCELVIQ